MASTPIGSGISAEDFGYLNAKNRGKSNRNIPGAGRGLDASLGALQVHNFPISAILTAEATLDFPNTAAQNNADLTIPVPGAQVGHPVFVGGPVPPDDSCFTAFVSAAGVVSVRFNNYSAGAINPASGAYRIVVFVY